MQHIFNRKLYISLLLIGFIPTIYTTLRIFFIGQLPSDYGFSIASQLTWVQLLYEVIIEAMILPMFYFISASKHKRKEFENKIRGILLVCFILTVSISIVFIFFAEPLLNVMAQNQNSMKESVRFVRVESISNIFSLLYRVCLVVFITLQEEKSIYKLLIVQMMLTLFFDTLFLSNTIHSLQVGVIGVAYSNVMIYITLFSLSIYMFRKKGVIIFKQEKIGLKWLWQQKKVCLYSAIETIIRNVVFIFMILRMMNVLSQQGEYWVANQFLYAWLLVPVFQLGELIKREFSEGIEDLKQQVKKYVVITSMVVGGWIVSIPLWEPFFTHILLLEDASVILEIVLVSLPFYIVFSYNNIIDSLFYAIGRTDLMLIQSLIVNILYYGCMALLYAFGIFTVTLMSIIVMFGVGIVLDALITCILLYKGYTSNTLLLEGRKIS